MTARRGTSGVAARARRPVAGLVGTAGAVALTLGFAAQGRLVLHDCVSAAGALGPLGLRLSVLQDSAECPEGSYGLGGVSRGAVVMLSVALPALVLYGLLTACGVGLSAVLVRVVRQARALLRGALPRVSPGLPGLAVRPGTGLRPSSRPSLPSVRVLVGSIARRGPPPATV